MSDIKDYVDFDASPSEVIEALKDKSVDVPSWRHLAEMYDYRHHPILRDHTNLRDKVRPDGTVEKSSRISIGMERLLVRRLSEFMFAIPARRVYKNTSGSDHLQEIARALESIYRVARIDAHNLKRSRRFFACCEMATFWYAVKHPNRLYGFESDFKLRCRTFTPMDGVGLYPLFDERGDLLALSLEYTVTRRDETRTFFETWTSDRHYKWETTDGCREVSAPEEIVIGKIPGVYLQRPEAVYEEVSELRKEIEYTLSRNSNVIAYNAAPILKIIGTLVGGERRGEDQRIFRLSEGGNLEYVSWQQAIEALKYNVGELKELFWALGQMPDISFSNMQSLGNIGFDARQTLLTDAHLKVGDESGDFIEFFDRELNVVKAFLGALRPDWKDGLAELEVEHVITPYIQRNESTEIETRMKANGGKALESRLESIERLGLSSDPQATLDRIRKEERQDAAGQTRSSMESYF